MECDMAIMVDLLHYDKGNLHQDCQADGDWPMWADAVLDNLDMGNISHRGVWGNKGACP